MLLSQPPSVSCFLAILTCLAALCYVSQIGAGQPQLSDTGRCCLMMPFSTVKCQSLRSPLHKLADKGTRAKFSAFLEEMIIPSPKSSPLSLVSAAKHGDRAAHLVILLDDDVVDPNFPPQMGEDLAQVLYSTSLYRFLMHVNNSDVAKQVLKEHGLKEIRLGMQGYPIHKDKVKRRPGGKAEVIYNYVQRPFLLMSWATARSNFNLSLASAPPPRQGSEPGGPE